MSYSRIKSDIRREGDYHRSWRGGYGWRWCWPSRWGLQCFMK